MVIETIRSYLGRESWIQPSIAPIVREYRRRFAATLAEWLRHHQHKIVFSECSWMGVRALKNPFDSWIYQEILFEVKPEVVIEIGSCEGGSTLFFAHLLEVMGGEGIVISVDIDRSNFVAHHDRIVTFTGDSSSPEILAKVRALCAGKRVLAIHDGDHSSMQVGKDLEAYAPLVTTGSYLIVEDGIVDLFAPEDGIGTFPAGGPLVATERFVREHPEFEVDESRERYILTYNPRGFLKRVRD